MFSMMDKMYQLKTDKLTLTPTEQPLDLSVLGGVAESHHSSSSSATSSATTPTPTTTSMAHTPGSGGESSASGRSRSHSTNHMKDESYWERRKKNNESAKRSRDARRAKETETAIKCAFLEQENFKLRLELATLKAENAEMRCLLYSTKDVAANGRK